MLFYEIPKLNNQTVGKLKFLTKETGVVISFNDKYIKV